MRSEAPGVVSLALYKSAVEGGGGQVVGTTLERFYWRRCAVHRWLELGMGGREELGTGCCRGGEVQTGLFAGIGRLIGLGRVGENG